MTYGDLIRAFADYAQRSGDIVAAVVIGSRARTERPADAHSDLDLVVIATDPARLVDSDSWLAELGPVRASFVEPTLMGQRERRALFDGGLDADFVVVDAAAAPALMADPDALRLFQDGCRVLVDKAGIVAPLAALCPRARRWEQPSEAAFVNQASDFWYHAVWASKKLMRGELWMAKSCVDSYMKSILLWMIECHAHAVDAQRDTWFSGRFLDDWCERWVLDALRECYARYDAQDVARALRATMALFRALGTDAAARLGYAYPGGADAYCSDWVERALGAWLAGSRPR